MKWKMDKWKKKKTNKTQNWIFEKVNKVDKPVQDWLHIKEIKHKLPISGMKEGHHYRSYRN